MEVGLSLGANLGDRQANLAEARDRIAAYPGIDMVAQSPIYETEPVDVPDEHRQRLFLNAVLIMETSMAVPRLLKVLQGIERQIGRAPHPVPNSPRPIDIDIVYAGGLNIRESHVRIPHPRWAERRFVVQPLCDLRPNLRLPGQAATVAEILARLQNHGQANLFTTNW